jgi:hypothetical protein
MRLEMFRVAAYTPRLEVSPPGKGRSTPLDKVSTEDIYVLDLDEVSSLRGSLDQPQQPASFAFRQGVAHWQTKLVLAYYGAKTKDHSNFLILKKAFFRFLLAGKICGNAI